MEFQGDVAYKVLPIKKRVFIAMIFFLPLNLLFIINFVLLKYSPQKFCFISFSLILLLSFSSTSLIFSPSGIFTPSDKTTFPLFNTITPHLFIRNSIPISLLNICTMETNLYTSQSLLAKIFKSSISKRCLKFSLFFKVFPDSAFLNICVRGTIQSKNSNGDKLSP